MRWIPLLIVLTRPCADAADPVAMARQSLPFLRSAGLEWIDNRQCASCHQIPSMLWSFNSAARAGDTEAAVFVAQWADWAADWRHWNKTGDQEGVEEVSAGNVDTMTFLLLSHIGLNEAGLDWQEEFKTRLLEHQEEDGSWKPGGQLPLGKRPARETAEVTTLWTLLALQTLPGFAIPEATQTKAQAFLNSAAPGRSTEWHAAKLLLIPQDDRLRQTLLNLQREDGGWGWLADEPGDAFGTGLALYALARSGLTIADEPVRRALDFLEKNRLPDGSWKVPGTRARDNNKITRTASYWGTAWATIALFELGRQTPTD